MNCRLPFPTRTVKVPDTIQDSISAFEDSLREKNHLLQDAPESLNNSRRLKLSLNSFLSAKSLSESYKHERKLRHSFVASNDFDYSRRTTLLEELKPISRVSLEETHGKEINAKKIFVREARRSRMSTFEAPKFQEDIQKLLDTEPEQGASSIPSVDRSEWADSTKIKKVVFSDVTVREYPIIVGDNPAGSGGPPLTIGWECLSSIDLDINKYEQARSGNRRKQEAMKMNKDHRQKLLRRLGFSMVEMQKGTKAANIVRNRRRRVNAELCRDSSNENIEKAMRRLRTFLTLGFQKRREQKYLKKACPNYGTRNFLRKFRNVASTATDASSLELVAE